MRSQNRSNRGRHQRRGGTRYAPRNDGGAPAAPQRNASKNLFERIGQAFMALFKKPAKAAPRSANGNRPPTRAVRVSESRVPRKPEVVEVSSAKLYVGNLSFDASESDLVELFSGVGSVQNAEIISHRQTQRSKGFGFVTMGTVEEARRAVEVLHDQDFMGRHLVVSGAKTPDTQQVQPAA